MAAGGHSVQVLVQNIFENGFNERWEGCRAPGSMHKTCSESEAGATSRNFNSKFPPNSENLTA